jgi:hypothetical protein
LLDIGIDQSDNELIALEIIHRFVQSLDVAFGNVSELDILFGMNIAYSVLNEVVVAGELSESSLKSVATQLKEMDHLLHEEILMENLGVEIRN